MWEALRAGRRVLRLRVDERARVEGKLEEILQLAARRDIAVSRVPRRLLDEQSVTGGHNGLIGEAEPRPADKLADVLASLEAGRGGRPPLLLVLSGWREEGDLGAVLRTADAVGVDAVVLPPGEGPTLSATARRVSMGGSEHLSLVRAPLARALAAIAEAGLRLVGLSADPGDPDLQASRLTGPLALVLDGAHETLPSAIRARCDSCLALRPVGGGARLPLAALAAVALYERERQIAAES